MSAIQQEASPLFEELVNGYNQLSVSGGTGRESSDLRRARQLAFDQFQLLGFPFIKHEDWKYTNINRFLKDEYALAAGQAGADVDALLAKAVIPGLDCYRVVLVNGVWDGVIVGGEL